MIIHFINTYPEERIPDKIKHCLQSWQNTPYELRFYNQEHIENLLEWDNKDFYNDYLKHLDIIYKVDYVRYIILREYGGMYIDMDIQLVNDFIPLLNPNKIYIAEGSAGQYVSNCILISPQGRLIWDNIMYYSQSKIIDKFEDCQLDQCHVMRAVGPLLLSEFLGKYKGDMVDKVELLSYHHFQSLTNEISFTRHYQIGSWLTNYSPTAK